MDGSFQDLDGESIEGKVDEFFREIFKVLKLFQQKQNKAEQEMEKTADTTRQCPGLDDQKKQESPTVLLCSTVMEQIKEFKVQHVAFLLNSLITGLVICEVLVIAAVKLYGMLCVFVSTGPHPSSFHLVQSRNQISPLGADVRDSGI